MHLERPEDQIPLSRAKGAAQSEAYATLHFRAPNARAIWLDAGCGWRLLEDDMEPLEDWLVDHGGLVVGLDPSVRVRATLACWCKDLFMRCHLPIAALISSPATWWWST